jgi:hypothetical protein
MVDLASMYFPPIPPTNNCSALLPATSVLIHPSHLADLCTFLNLPGAIWCSPKQGEVIKLMQARRKHLLAIIACDYGKTTLILMQIKMYDEHLVTVVVLPLSGLHHDLRTCTNQHKISAAQWLPGQNTFNMAVSLIYVSVKHAIWDEFREYVP